MQGFLNFNCDLTNTFFLQAININKDWKIVILRTRKLLKLNLSWVSDATDADLTGYVWYNLGTSRNQLKTTRVWEGVLQVQSEPKYAVVPLLHNDC
jgi:hypothetical protein